MSGKTFKKLIHCFALLCLLVLTISSAFSLEKTIELGGKSGWQQLSVAEGITTGPGRFGYEAIQLDSNTVTVSAYTDLLLSFEDEIKDKSNRYFVENNGCRITDDSAMGKGSAIFNGKNGLLLDGMAGTVFGTEGWTGSFVLEFWLCPSIVENGETLILWRSNRNERDYPLYQMFSAVFTGSHIEWNLTNIFSGYTADSGEVKINGLQTLIPGQWSHHALVYSEDTGLIEYRVNGLLEDLKYITSTGNERGSVYPLFMGSPSKLELCPQYTGKLDDFRILRSNGTEEDAKLFSNIILGKGFSRYDMDGGRFETQPLSVTEGSSLLRLNADVSQPEQTDVQFYVRSGDNFYEWTDSYPSWKPVSIGGDISDITGKYFQVAAQLYPDGSGNISPSVTSVSVVYQENQPPLPPFSVKAKADDGSVSISWSHSIDNITGYYVYYGERPGEYLGRIALEGYSPVAVGKNNSLKLNGLKNGRIYYFAVAAENNGRIGSLSSEVYARPTMKME